MAANTVDPYADAIAEVKRKRDSGQVIELSDQEATDLVIIQTTEDFSELKFHPSYIELLLLKSINYDNGVFDHNVIDNDVFDDESINNETGMTVAEIAAANVINSKSIIEHKPKLSPMVAGIRRTPGFLQIPTTNTEINTPKIITDYLSNITPTTESTNNITPTTESTNNVSPTTESTSNASLANTTASTTESTTETAPSSTFVPVNVHTAANNILMTAKDLTSHIIATGNHLKKYTDDEIESAKRTYPELMAVFVVLNSTGYFTTDPLAHIPWPDKSVSNLSVVTPDTMSVPLPLPPGALTPEPGCNLI
jgi:hypothetical protein